MTVRVLLIDDHPIVRAGLRAVLEAAGLEVVAEASSGEEGVVLAGHLAPDVALCDLRLGEGMDGAATAAALGALPDPAAVVVLSTFDSDADVFGAIRAGALSYVRKGEPPERIVVAIEAAARGETSLAPDLAARVMRGMRSTHPELTAREREVLRHLATGESNRDIAKALFVSEATVKTHLVHIFAKLDVDSRSRAVHEGRRRGLVR
ncbi:MULTISPECIES: response regulator transcription factor [unclassified Pseudactinotalea]|uniref:response regulator n=1 Tax=unclassified Pseudactinotalea TaxID=2649176 RepID=UPI00128E4082|nr:MULTISPECIES: response regulator transcription factor [unclassified Pseudactinotalea]MPV48819.1 response regulator [Pseudactinotalea sp. HY160]QGH68802.1 response regulator [Pseudactinotalea sp. HY158]